jgi:hypothetical protein
MPASDPHIIPRAAWGANPLVTPAGSILTPTEELWLHHTGGEQFDEAGMRMLQQYAMHHGYVDLEYTFVLDHVDCKVFKSRGVGKNSAATGGHNTVSHAVCVMGYFQDVVVNGVVVRTGDVPSDKLIATLANLVAWGFEHGWWKHCAFTGGHRDASGNSTACPGNKLEAVIPKINALALQIHGATTGGNVIPKLPHGWGGGVVDGLVIPGVGAWLLGDDGGIWTLSGHFYGAAAGQAYFAGRHGARLVVPGTVVPGAAPPQGGPSPTRIYEIIATSGERYVPTP